MLGAIHFTNVSKSPCTLRGFVNVDLLDQNGRVVVDRTEHGLGAAAGGVINEVDTIDLHPGRPNEAEVPIQFTCHGVPPVVRVARVELPDGTTLDAKPGDNPWTVQSCSPGSGTSTLSEEPVQAQSN
jgi:hypothetical protein